MAKNEKNNKAGVAVLSRPILVTLDGTKVAEGILPYISQIAKKANIPLVLFTVVDPAAVDYSAASSASPFADPATQARVIYRDQIEESSRVHALDSLHGMASRLRKEGIEAKARVDLGNPATEILRVADEEECGLIAMSTHGRNAIGRSIFGSVTNKVLHASHTPVLTITPERAKKYQEAEGTVLKTIVVPLDGSARAERVLPYVEELAGILSLEVLLVRAVQIEYPPYTHAGFGAMLPDFTEGVAHEATEYLERVSLHLGNKGLTVRHELLRGAAASALVHLAHETPRNLIAMTTHGRSGLSRWMMGSVAEALVRGSGDPVLVIRSQS